MKHIAATAGINVVACEVKKCSGSAFIPMTMEQVAEVRAGYPKIVKAQATCGHYVEVEFTGTHLR